MKTCIAVAASALLLAAPSFAGGIPEPKTSVVLAKSWDAAIAEAKALNVPLVVHNHGMFCGPCWSMHDSVMCNKKYIDFANDNTVEVIALDSLQEGITKKDRRAETYDAKVDGKAVKYMVEFPGLTVDDMLGLRNSKAGTYNTTGKIPYTSVVDPWTETEVTHWNGGQPAKTIGDAVLDARKALAKDHGKGTTRKELKAVTDAEATAASKADKGDFTGALDALTAVQARVEKAPSMKDGLDAAKAKIVEAAEKALAAIEEKKETDAATAKKDLAALLPRLKGTGLEQKASDLLKAL